MSDRELLQLAAKAAGLSIDSDDNGNPLRVEWFRDHLRNEYPWNPLADDGDALRLAVKLGMAVSVEYLTCSTSALWGPPMGVVREVHDTDSLAATRRAIVRAAAQIGASHE